MGTRLYVGNLSYETMEEDLQEMFKEAGEITKCDVILDKFTGKSRGFAFIEMTTQEGATKAVELFDGKDLQGRNLRVNEARPREERSGGGHGGGHGGGGHGGGGRGGHGGGGHSRGGW